MARLRRISDNAGDVGNCSQAIGFNEDKTEAIVLGDRPMIGCLMKVGSSYARSYSLQDYWLTTPVTEILEETEDYVRFKTKNSEYEWYKR